MGTGGWGEQNCRDWRVDGAIRKECARKVKWPWCWEECGGSK